VDGIAGGTTVYAAMRAQWRWLDPIENVPGEIGTSDVILVTLATAPEPPPAMIGLKSFSLTWWPIPEPQTLFLLLLGAPVIVLQSYIRRK